MGGLVGIENSHEPENFSGLQKPQILASGHGPQEGHKQSRRRARVPHSFLSWREIHRSCLVKELGGVCGIHWLSLTSECTQQRGPTWLMRRCVLRLGNRLCSPQSLSSNTCSEVSSDAESSMSHHGLITGIERLVGLPSLGPIGIAGNQPVSCPFGTCSPHPSISHMELPCQCSHLLQTGSEQRRSM